MNIISCTQFIQDSILILFARSALCGDMLRTLWRLLRRVRRLLREAWRLLRRVRRGLRKVRRPPQNTEQCKNTLLGFHKLQLQTLRTQSIHRTKVLLKGLIYSYQIDCTFMVVIGHAWSRKWMRQAMCIHSTCMHWVP